MVDDGLGSIEGPRTLRYFAMLLMIVVLLFVLGVVLSQFYGFTLLEGFTRIFVDDPMILLDLAGFLALVVLMITIGRFVSQYVE